MDPPVGSQSEDDQLFDFVTPGVSGPDGPRYLNLPDGILWPSRTQRTGTFISDLLHDSRRISDSQLDALLQPERKMANWRDRLVAAFLIALDRRVQFGDAIRNMLLANEVGYVGMSYCFALASFGSHRDAESLVAYLDTNLANVQARLDQSWALGALLYLDRQLGTDRAALFIRSGAWERWAGYVPAERNIEFYLEGIEKLCSLTRSTRSQARDTP